MGVYLKLNGIHLHCFEELSKQTIVNLTQDKRG